MTRFDYVKYDDEATDKQDAFKELFIRVSECVSEGVKCPRSKALVNTKLEEAYMWIGKGIRNDQIERNGSAPSQEERCDS